MNESQRIDRLEPIYRTQQRIVDSVRQHLDTMAGRAQNQGLDLPMITMTLVGSQQSAVQAARRL